MKQLGVSGFPLDHTYSPSWFERRFRDENISGWQYDVFPVEQAITIPRLFLRHPLLVGLNVTIPHKEAVIPYLDRLTPDARRVGAVNTVRREQDGSLTGHNTDVLALEDVFQQRPERPAQALVLGTGGASRAVITALEKFSIASMRVSRSPDNERASFTYQSLTYKLIAQTPWIINTTPLGMHPHVDELPALPYDALGKGHWLLDLIYNPPTTCFLAEGVQRGAEIENGARILALQAEHSWRFFQHKAYSFDLDGNDR